MSGFELFKLAFATLRSHPLRSGLSVFSITIGSFIIVFISSVAQSGLNALIRGIEEIGFAQSIGIMGKTIESNRNQIFPYEFGIQEFDSLLQDLPELESYVWIHNQKLILDSKPIRTALVGTNPAFFRTFGYKLQKGRFFSEHEFQTSQPSCVLASHLAKELDAQELLGKSISVASLSCTVVGITQDLTQSNVNFGFEWNHAIFIPESTASAYAENWEVRNRWLIAKAKSKSLARQLKERILERLDRRHLGVDDYQLWDFASSIQQFQQVFLIMRIFVAVVASIALLIGGIGIMNIMLVSVSERVREIGLRKALGASPQIIVKQFLTESLLLTSLGGLCGIGLALAGNFIGALFIKQQIAIYEAEISWESIGMALLSSSLLGIIFGSSPAKRAAQLEPAWAMQQ